MMAPMVAASEDTATASVSPPTTLTVSIVGSVSDHRETRSIG